jgi:hypothetical protein
MDGVRYSKFLHCAYIQAPMVVLLLCYSRSVRKNLDNFKRNIIHRFKDKEKEFNKLKRKLIHSRVTGPELVPFIVFLESQAKREELTSCTLFSQV